MIKIPKGTKCNKEKEINMMKLNEIREDMNLVNAIDWQMTPEEAVV